MLKIKALKINITTDRGLYGTPVLGFSEHLTIVKGFNSTGKSTLFQSILYCIGLEELIGGKNEKTMQSVLKSEILNNDNSIDARVIESSILLEIEGVSVITVKRYVASPSKNAGLIEVYEGPMLTRPGQYDYIPMYVHDKGAADNENVFGFHSYLERFIGWSLPTVQYKDGSNRKLYLQNIFPSFIIEQKAGWTDFLATIPYYSLLDKETRALEFLLNLDSWKIQQEKYRIKKEKEEIAITWRELYIELKSIASQIACEVKGVDINPSIIESINSIYLYFRTENDNYILPEYIQKLQDEYKEISELELPIIGDRAVEGEIRINELNDKLSSLSINLSNLINKKNLALSKYASFKERLSDLQNDKKQNEYHLKVKKKGADSGFEIANDYCPFCSQKLDDSLLPKDIEIIPMQIEENIEYIKAQINLINIYIANHEKDIIILDGRIGVINNAVAETRSEIRSLKTQLTSDNRLPSIELIEKRIRLSNKLDLYRKKYDEIAFYQERFIGLSSQWLELLGDEKGLPNSLSSKDYKKISELEVKFKSLLRDFHYRSKPIESISISRETLMPVVDRYSLKFDSSASDFIRTIWSYSLSLMETSQKFDGNHPNLIIFDEPGNQEAGNNDLRILLDKLSKYEHVQTIIFSSFHQSDSTYKECTNGVKFSLIDLGKDKFIKKL